MRPEKLNLKLAQRKMLEIANPGLVSVDEIKKWKIHRANLITLIVNIVDVPTTKLNALPLAKLVIIVVVKTILNLNADLREDLANLANLSQSMTQGGQMEPEKINVHAVYMKSMKIMRTAQWRT